MGKYTKLAKDIVKNIGGKENINTLTHCVTRLRFKLKDESKANDEVLKNMDGVVTVMKSAGQYQVVIGNHVSYVYEDICEIAGIKGDTSGSEDEDDAPQGWFNKLIDIISRCFQPILGVMSACGMIKGVNALFVFLGLYSQTSGTYITLNAIGDSIFYFMPVVIGYTSARRFKLNPILGMAIGAALCHPSIQKNTLAAAGDAIGQLFGTDYFITFAGIPLSAANYTSSVIPVILVVVIAAKLEKFFKKVIPEMVQSFIVPFCVLLVSLVLGFLVIGPIISVLTELLMQLFMKMYEFSPILTGGVVGLLWQVLVIFGLHWALIPLKIINIATQGFDNILIGSFGCSFAQTACVFAMYLKLKDKKKKELAIPAVISGICGVTEPAIYGFSLPAKTPFIFSMIAGAISGAIFTASGSLSYTMGGLGIFGVVNFIDTATGEGSGMIWSFVCIAIAMVIGFLLTFFFWKDKEEPVSDTGSTDANVIKKNSELTNVKEIYSPLKGALIPLKELDDSAFSQGALGLGAAIEPTEGKLYAPESGVVTTLFPTYHSLGITTDDGVEILIHIGMDTVQLEGKGFKPKIKQGDRVKKGQLLMEFDIPAIKKAGYPVVTPIVITNTANFTDIVEVTQENVAVGDVLLYVMK